MADTALIGLFPLGIVLYPGEQRGLHIFEPRYKLLIGQCIESEDAFGVVLFNNGRIADVGCLAKIHLVERQYEDGRMDIVIRGYERFAVKQIVEEAAYLQGEVEPMPDTSADVDSALTERVITQHMKLLELAGRTVRPAIYERVKNISYIVARNSGLSLEQKQAVLEMKAENERIQYLAEHLESFIPRVEEMETLRAKIQSNGHFLDFPPEASE